MKFSSHTSWIDLPVLTPTQRISGVLASLVVALALSGGAPDARAQSVGSVTAVNISATGTPPGGRARTLTLGGRVVQRERIQTDARGSAQITFADRASMSIGANSAVVIDQFVFGGAGAPAGGVMAASLTRGALRFVGGQVSHTSGASVKTPVATIGVRGGVVTIIVEAGPGGRPRVRVINHFGIATISNGAGSFVISRGGFQSIIDSPNLPPGDGGRIDQGMLRQIMARLTSGQGQNGGSQNPPNNQSAARNKIGHTRHAVETPAIDPHAVADDIARSRPAEGDDYYGHGGGYGAYGGCAAAGC